MVWLPGGGNTQGSTAEFQARRMATRGDVVVVTVNYRLGVFGFFGHSGLPGSGTFGLQDQQAALRWVHDNAGAFGGDAGNVTLFGQSAGAIDACAQLTSPASAGLFDRAILQSGSCASQVGMITFGHATPAPTAQSYWQPLKSVLTAGAAAASTMGCTDTNTAVACIRALEPSRLLDLTAKFATPAYGTPILPKEPGHAIVSGEFHRVPIVTGVTRDEFRLLTALAEYSDGHITADRYRTMLSEAFGQHAASVYARYPDTAYDSPGEAWAALDTDRGMVCPNLFDAQAMAARTRVNTYEFADRNAPPYAGFPPDAMPPGASHGSELAYLFDLEGRTDVLTPTQRTLSHTMIDYWTTFARTGDPNSRRAPDWSPLPAPRRHPTRPETTLPTAQALAPGSHGIGLVTTGRDHQCDFWNHLDRPVGHG